MSGYDGSLLLVWLSRALHGWFIGWVLLGTKSRALWMFLVFVCIYVYLRLTLYELTLALKIKTLILMNQKSVTYATIIVLVYHYANYLERSISDEGDYEQRALMKRLTIMDNDDFHNQLCIWKDAIPKLVNKLRGMGHLRNSAHNNIEEQITKFLHIVGHNLRNRILKFHFK